MSAHWDPPAFTAEITPACGGSPGAIDLTMTQGVPPYTFDWSNGATTEDISCLSPGIYSVYITGSNGCDDWFTLEVPTNNITLSGSVTADNSCAADNGGVTLTVDPPGSYTFAWSDGSTAQNLSGVPPGTYTVTATNAAASGCTQTATFDVPDGTDPPAVASIEMDSSFCGLPTGSLDLSVSGGAFPVSYAWSGGATTQNLDNLLPGTYSVTVTDGGGCTATGSATVVNSALTPEISGSALPSTSCSPPNGSVNIEVGPAGNYFFAWSNGAGTEDIAGLPGGAYSVTATTGSCWATGTFFVDESFSQPSISAAASPATCGQANGSLDLTVTGGLAPYSYLWSNGATAQDLAGVPPGSYSVTVGDAGGCTETGSYDVADNQPPPDTTLLAGTTCDESMAGVFVQNLTGMDGCDSVVISDIALLPSDTVHVAGTTCDEAMAGVFVQNLTGMDGCDSVVISTISLLPGDTVHVSGTTCDEAIAGVFVQNLTGVNGCDSVVISDIALLPGDTVHVSGTTCDESMAGVFTQTLVNQNGCDSVVISEIALLAGDTVLLLDTTCDPASVGVFEQVLTNQAGCDSVVVTTVTYAEADTTILSGTTCDPSQAGVFVQTFTTPQGCDSTVISSISLSPSDTVYVSGTVCDENMAGVFEQILSNQYGCDSIIVSTLTYVPADTVIISGITCDAATAGVFTDIFTNQYGCDSIVIENISLFPGDITYIFDTSCDAANTGISQQIFANQYGCDSTVILSVSFAESDTTVLASATCDPAQAGTFWQYLTSADGCDSIVQAVVAWVPGDSVTLSATTCDPGQAGVFTSVFQNQNGCDSVVTTTVSLLPSDSVFLTTETCDPGQAGVFTSVFQNQNGCDSVVATIVGLLPSDSVFLSAETCDATQAGVFTETFSNQNGCDSVVTTTVSLLPGDTVFLASSTCNPTQAGVFTSVFQNQNGCDSTVVTQVDLLPGDTVFLASTTCDPTLAGVFTETFSNQNGCDSVVVTAVSLSPSPALAVTASDFNGFGVGCSGAADGSAGVTVSGGVGPFSYLWSNGGTGQEIEGLPAGNYTVTVTTAAGCTATAGVLLAEPPPLSAAFSVTPLDCFGENDGAVFVQAGGGAPPYLFSLNGGALQASNAFSGLSAGTYTAAVQDANGCGTSEILWINAPVPVEVELGDDLTIALGENATVHAVVNLPPGQLANVTWSGLDSAECPACLEQPVAPLLTTAYSVSIVDVNGCGDGDEVTVFVDRRKHVYVPNAFSPNGDGINDVFLIFAKDGQVKSVRSFLVFDRWGESVHEFYNFLPGDPAHGWDGRHRGQELDAAVFVWFADIEFVDGTSGLLEGEVVLVR